MRPELREWAGRGELLHVDRITDFTKLELKLLYELNGESGVDLNARVLSSLLRLRGEGFRLAGIAAVDHLLTHPELIPEEWSKIADSDWMYEKRGSIRFDGTQVITPDGERFVLAPFVARGNWIFGFANFLETPERNEEIRLGRNFHDRAYTVVSR